MKPSTPHELIRMWRKNAAATRRRTSIGRAEREARAAALDACADDLERVVGPAPRMPHTGTPPQVLQTEPTERVWFTGFGSAPATRSRAPLCIEWCDEEPPDAARTPGDEIDGPEDVLFWDEP